jgi:hypothetical protein
MVREVDRWREELERGVKTRRYREMKGNWGYEKYLDCDCTRWEVANYVKWRAGVYELRVEVGRWERLSREERVCEFCDSGEVEDELHCLLRCTRWEERRRLVAWRGNSEEEFVRWWLGGTDSRGAAELEETARVMRGIGEWTRMRKEEKERMEEEEKERLAQEEKTRRQGRRFRWKVKVKPKCI